MRRILFLFGMLCCFTPTTRAALSPQELVIVAARGNKGSEDLAKYYARVRGVPAENICTVDVPKEETIPREMWQWGVRPEIQKWLTEHDPQRKIRCLVTTWGIPLRIGPAKADPQLEKYKAFLEAERAHRMELLNTIRQSLDKIAPKGELAREDVPRDADSKVKRNVTGAEGSSPLFQSTESGASDTDKNKSAQPDTTLPSAAGDAKSTPGPAQAGVPEKPKSDLDTARTALEKSLQDAQVRLGKLSAGEVKTNGQIQLQQLATAAGGVNVLLQGLNQRLTNTSEPDANVRTEFDLLRGRTGAFGEMQSLLDQTACGIQRDALLLAIVERMTGLLGTVSWLDGQLEVVRQNETGAAFDNELSLVMWPDDYQLLRWQPNYLRPGFDNSQLPKIYRTLMVARIDAPTLALAKGMIDTAIKVEKEGLRGKVYIDGRGIAKLTDANSLPGSYADFDRSLLITGKGIEDLTDLDVVVESTPQLFQPGQCKDAALYCGWYSLGKYVDAFDWKPGAVAYHLASSEAETLRDPQSQVWCKKMLEDGVCATIGPVYEPYLVAFPRPNEFFAMLVQGDLTLVECYYRSEPFTSWMMTLLGDPLYRPFKYRSDASAQSKGPGVSSPRPANATRTEPEISTTPIPGTSPSGSR